MLPIAKKGRGLSSLLIQKVRKGPQGKKKRKLNDGSGHQQTVQEEEGPDLELEVSQTVSAMPTEMQQQVNPPSRLPSAGLYSKGKVYNQRSKKRTMAEFGNPVHGTPVSSRTSRTPTKLGQGNIGGQSQAIAEEQYDMADDF